jgi:hypothetical protein
MQGQIIKFDNIVSVSSTGVGGGQTACVVHDLMGNYFTAIGCLMSVGVRK